ncbi:MAG: type I restriction endonuclease subunit R [Alphaproteobacteria bacterium]|jgi:type I restriction enzyme R subunit|nr:type I restriction endonuclease subunit R [Alphaproteobacteria bacterium]
MQKDNFKNPFNEQMVEDYAIGIFQDKGYQYLSGEEINPLDENGSCLRSDFDIAYYLSIFRDVVFKINSDLSSEVIEEAINEVIRSKHTNLVQENKRIFQLLTGGVKINHKDRTLTVRLVDFENVENNSFVVSNQLILKEHNKHRRPDVMIYLNGLPISMIEFKNPADKNATLKNAFNQLETYKREFPQAFYFNQFNIISDGFHSRVGSLSAGYDRFNPWRSEDDDKLEFEIEGLIRDLFDKKKLLHYIKNFVTFINSKGKDVKICAGYHQVRCVNSSLEAIKKAVDGDKRGGLVWHSTGSGKSFSMMFLAGMIEKDLKLENPTILVVTDRVALDSQLFKTFSSGEMILGSKPVNIQSSGELKTKLEGIKAGGVYFSTLQKFGIDKKGRSELVFKTLSERDNIIVMVDEAHRSHNGIDDGSARYLRDAFPNATFIGFTGTPIEKGNNDTRAIFGDDNDVYDMAQSVIDGATVPIRYEARLAQVKLNDDKISEINKLFDEIEGITDLSYSESLKSKNAKLEAILGSPERLKLLAKDISKHFGLRKEVLPFSKAMIVCSTRNVAVKLYEMLVSQNPEWHSDDVDKGKIKMVYSSSASDSEDLLKYKTSSADKEVIAKRLEDENDELDFIIVCDMWLTGFDAPPINTMYFDKLIKEHNLIQAIARANRVYKEKPDGLIVDYIGILGNLKDALAIYSPRDKGVVGENIREKAVDTMMAKYSNISDLLFGFDYKDELLRAYKNNDSKILFKLKKDLFNFIVGSDDKEKSKQFVKWTTDFQKSYSLCATTDKAESIRYELVFFCAVKELILKNTNICNERKLKLEDINTKIGNLASQAVEGVKIFDLLDLASINKNQIDIFSEDFLNEIKKFNNKNLALEMLKKLISDDVKERARHSVIEARNFGEMLKELVSRYHNNQIDSTQMIEELINLSKHIALSDEKKKELGLTDEEIQFYTALADNKSAVEVMGDNKLKELTKALVFRCKRRVNFNFLERSDVQARLRVEVKKLLKEFGYPPNMEKLAIDNVVKQSMLIGMNIVG